MFFFLDFRNREFGAAVSLVADIVALFLEFRAVLRGILREFFRAVRATEIDFITPLHHGEGFGIDGFSGNRAFGLIGITIGQRCLVLRRLLLKLCGAVLAAEKHFVPLVFNADFGVHRFSAHRANQLHFGT